MKKLFVTAALLLASSVAFAQGSVTVEWTNPTMGINTTTGALEPLNADSAITNYKLWFSKTPTTGVSATPTVEFPAAVPLQTSYVYTGLSYGDTVYVRLVGCNKYGCSDPSGEANGTVPFPPVIPNAPQNITIRITLQ